MLFRLASLLGRSVGELEATVAQPELEEWFAFYQLEPWGYGIESWRAAMGPYVAAQISAGRRKRYRIEDFMPELAARRPPVTMDLLRMWLGAKPAEG